MTTNKFFAIVPGAGIGSRMSMSIPKQYLKINDSTVIETTLKPFLQADNIEKVIVALNPSDTYFHKLEIANHPKIIVCEGGNERFLSVYNALNIIADLACEDDWILVHDAVRPCFSGKDLQNFIECAKDEKIGAICALESHNTLKHVNTKEHEIIATLNRQQIYSALTPQMFRYKMLLDAHNSAIKSGNHFTDDAHVMEHAGWLGKIVLGKRNNIKITCKDDLKIAKFFLDKIYVD